MATRLIPATPDTLRRTLKHRPVLWVGAGASVAAGHPSTGTLVDAMVAEADDPIDPASSFEQIADAFVESQGPGALEDLLQRLVGASLPLTDLHRALARQAGDGKLAALVTTNYDDLLERALAEAEARYVFQTLEDNAVVVDPQADVRLLKLHGSRDDWRHAVLSGDAYATFGGRYPFLEKQLDVLLRRHRVLFVGCSLRDPRILDWLAALDDDALSRLKPWRAMMARRSWDDALAAGEALRRAVDAKILRPLILDDHGHLPRLWTEVAPPPAATEPMELLLTVGPSGLEARLDGGEPWHSEDLLDDERFVAAVGELQKLGMRPFPTDEDGRMTPDVAALAARLRELAAGVGTRLELTLFSEAAHQRLTAAVHAGLGGRPALLRLRVTVADGADDELVHRADRLLALPWELLCLDGAFPVEEHTLDLAREAVVDDLEGLGEPRRPLSILATVAAPIDAGALDHEGETYRLWRALGARDEDLLTTTDLGTLDDLLETLEALHRDRHDPTVLHFIGHGTPGALLFEDETAASRPVKVEELVRRLRLAGPFPRLIYLSACHGTTAGPGTTAASLHRGGFAQVVAFFGPVGDAQATRTAAAFYAALATGIKARAAPRPRRGRRAPRRYRRHRPGHLPPRLGAAGLLPPRRRPADGPGVDEGADASRHAPAPSLRARRQDGRHGPHRGDRGRPTAAFRLHRTPPSEERRGAPLATRRASAGGRGARRVGQDGALRRAAADLRQGPPRRGPRRTTRRSPAASRRGALAGGAGRRGRRGKRAARRAAAGGPERRGPGPCPCRPCQTRRRPHCLPRRRGEPATRRGRR